MKNAGLKITLLVGMLLLVAGIVYVNIDQIKKLFKKATGATGIDDNSSAAGVTGNTNTGSSGSTIIPNAPANLDFNKVLKYGVYNSQEVAFLQQLMNSYQPSSPIVVDGDFGTNTLNKLSSITKGKLTQITLNQIYKGIQNGFQ